MSTAVDKHKFVLKLINTALIGRNVLEDRDVFPGVIKVSKVFRPHIGLS